MGDVALAADLEVVVLREVDLFKVDGGAVGRLAEVVDGDILDGDLDLVASRREERLDGLVLAVGLDGGVGEAAVEEIERLGPGLADGRAPPAVVLGDELDEEVADLGVLRLPAEAVVAERLGAADVGDADDQRLEVLERLVGL